MSIEREITGEHRAFIGGNAPAYTGSDWEFIEATPDGWIEWQGGECPLTDGVNHQAKTRDGCKSEIVDTPGCFRWSHWGDYSDIIAYRPILDADTKPEPPAWDGAGLPPVGCECREIGVRRRVRIIAHASMPSYGGETGVAVYQDMGEAKEIGWGFEHAFEPIHSKSQRAEDAIAAEVLSSMDNGIGAVFKDAQIAKAVYAAIRDGKIPGVRLDD